MIKDIQNPWENMETSTQRRVDIETLRDFFWMTDLEGNYGFYIKRNEVFEDEYNLKKLRGFSILKRNSDENRGELFLIAHQKTNWQIFYAICQDLILVSHNCETDEEMTQIFEDRLEQWGKFLSRT